ncbi:MAG: glycosyltransferase [Sandaracinaceae bacterium]
MSPFGGDRWRRLAQHSVSRAIHDRVVAAELRVHRAAMAWRRPSSTDLSDLTLLVKTFERPLAARRLVASVRRLYPRLAIVVVDDSRRPAPIDGCRSVVLPYDQGLSAGRNAGLAVVDTTFVLLADDDFVFFAGTRLEPTLQTMRDHPAIDLAGGVRIDLPFHRVLPSRHRRPHGLAGPLPTGTIGGLPRRAMVPNFFMARAARVREVGWDPALKLVEHSDFFGRALGVLAVVEDPRLQVLHARTLGDRAYMAHRENVEPYLRVLRRKWRRR